MLDLWHIQNIDWLQRLRPDDIARLKNTGKIKHFSAGSRIFSPARQPDDVYIMETGLARIYRESRDAEQVTLGYIRPGEVFGECALFDGCPRESFAEATENSVALQFPRQEFAEIVRLNPSIGFAVTTQIEGRFKSIETRLEDLVFRNANQRLAHTLLQLSERFGERDQPETRLPLRLTQTDLATLIGTSRPTANLAFNQLRETGLVSRDQGNIVLHDAAKLRRLVDIP